MRCIHIYRGAPQLGGIKLHKHFSWFHTVKWGVHRIAPRTVLHVIRIVLTMELQPLKTVELHGWCVSPIHWWETGQPPRFTRITNAHTHTHTHTHVHVLNTDTYTHTHTHTHTCIHYTLHPHIHVHTHTHTHTHTHVYRHTHTHTCTHMHTHTHTVTHTHTHTRAHTSPTQTNKLAPILYTYLQSPPPCM